jgi:beta-lactamase regulating signal transducer with metallopeptidase domain
MIVPLMLYTLAVGALIAAAALGLEGALRLAGRPTRWVWAGALLLALGLVATAPYRVAAPMVTAITTTTAVAAPPAAPQAASLVEVLAGSLRSALHAATAVPLARLGAVVTRTSGSSWNTALLAGWGVLSSLALLAFAWTALRYRAIRSRSPRTRLHDTDVRITGELGPAVVGLFRHEIVVPRWLLGAGAEEQRLILAHETEHRRARDPLLLAGGWLAIVLVPWHPAVWWMTSRLRLATEVDCDARVLRRGVEPLAYGSLLIAIAGRCAGIRVGVSALADSQSHLEQRLTAMTPRSRTFPLARGAALGALALTAVLAACEASMPTAAEVQNLDVAGLEKKVAAVRISDVDDAQYFVNGVEVVAAKARAIAPEEIASIRVMKLSKEVVKSAAANPDSKASVSQIRIVTKDAPAGTDADPLVGDRVVRVNERVIANPGSAEAAGEGQVRLRVRGDGIGNNGGPDPLIFIDGVAANSAAMSALKPDRIMTIDVIKGPTATAEYGAGAAGGVIKVTTKK